MWLRDSAEIEVTKQAALTVAELDHYKPVDRRVMLLPADSPSTLTGRSAARLSSAILRHGRAGCLWRRSLRARVAARNHVLPVFAHTPIAVITRADVQDWINTLDAKGLSPNTIRQIYRAVV